jgi:hypothetical protein
MQKTAPQFPTYSTAGKIHLWPGRGAKEKGRGIKKGKERKRKEGRKSQQQSKQASSPCVIWAASRRLMSFHRGSPPPSQAVFTGSKSWSTFNVPLEAEQ